MSTKQALKRCGVFSALSGGELEKIASLAIEKQYDAGAVIFREGDSAEELLVLQEGKVAVQTVLPKEAGQVSRRITVDVVVSDEIVGWSALVEPYTYTFTGVCLQTVKALSLSSSKLRSILQENSEIGYEVLKELIKVVASRLDETRRVLISERSLPPKAE